MTDHLNTLRLLRSFAAGDHADALDAAIERFSLPVLTTCDDCTHSVKFRGVARGCSLAETEKGLRTVEDATKPPPAWCPLRGKP